MPRLYFDNSDEVAKKEIEEHIFLFMQVMRYAISKTMHWALDPSKLNESTEMTLVQQTRKTLIVMFMHNTYIDDIHPANKLSYQKSLMQLLKLLNPRNIDLFHQAFYDASEEIKSEVVDQFKKVKRFDPQVVEACVRGFEQAVAWVIAEDEVGPVPFPEPPPPSAPAPIVPPVINEPVQYVAPESPIQPIEIANDTPESPDPFVAENNSIVSEVAENNPVVVPPPAHEPEPWAESVRSEQQERLRATMEAGLNLNPELPRALEAIAESPPAPGTPVPPLRFAPAERGERRVESPEPTPNEHLHRRHRGHGHSGHRRGGGCRLM